MVYRPYRETINTYLKGAIMPEYLILSVYRSGKFYKPMIRAKFRKEKAERIYKIFRASDEGFSDRERALDFGIKTLAAGHFLSGSVIVRKRATF
jgi:hypothetical protein